MTEEKKRIDRLSSQIVNNVNKVLDGLEEITGIRDVRMIPIWFPEFQCKFRCVACKEEIDMSVEVLNKIVEISRSDSLLHEELLDILQTVSQNEGNCKREGFTDKKHAFIYKQFRRANDRK